MSEYLIGNIVGGVIGLLVGSIITTAIIGIALFSSAGDDTK